MRKFGEYGDEGARRDAEVAGCLYRNAGQWGNRGKTKRLVQGVNVVGDGE